MGLTIHQQPPVIAPVYNPMVFTLTSDNSGNVNFRYVITITVNGTNIIIKQSPNPDGYCVIDVRRFLEDYITYDFSNAGGFVVNTTSFIKYSMNFAEEFGDPPAPGVAFVNVTNNTAWNAAIDYLDWLLFDVTDYELLNTSKKFLTYAPRTQVIGRNQDAFLYWIYPNIVGTKVAKIRIVFDAGTADFDNAFSPPSTAQFFQRFNIGTRYLNANAIGFSDTNNYTVQTLDGSNNPTSELFTFTVDYLCTKYKVYRLHFLNKLGGFDAVNFILRDTLTADITRTNFEKTLGNFVAPTYNYLATNHGTIQDNTTVKDSIQVNSNWITNEQAIWLKELFSSPLVYLEDYTLNPSGGYVPIVITDTKYQTKKSVPGEKLFNIIVNFSFAVTNQRQRF